MGAIVLAAGLVGIARRSNRFHAVAQVAIVPKGPTAGADLETVSGLFARAYGDDALTRAALRAADFTDRDISRVSVSGQLLAGSAVVRIDAASSDPVIAENAATAIAGDPPKVAGLSGYETQITGEATGTAHRTGGGTGALVAATAVMAVAAGLAASVVWRRIPPRR
jgi:hypothetical protein